MATENQIKRLFRYDLQADILAIHMTLDKSGNTCTPELKERIEKTQTMQNAIDTFYALLSENERFVVQRHYVDRIDWNCLAMEFAQKWGEQNTKSKRGMINYLNSAFKHMVLYIERNKDVFDFSWLDAL